MNRLWSAPNRRPRELKFSRITGTPVIMKHELQELVIRGGQPAFSEGLHVGRPNMGNRAAFMRRLEDILDRRWFTNDGPYVREFEARLAETLGVKHCVATCNGTVALEILIRALGMTGEVLLPSFTFVATAHALRWQEITPVFCDVCPATHSIDPACVEQMITTRTTGIIGVHLWGRPCDVRALEDIAARHRMALIFDAAHALGCSYDGRMVGSFGDAEVLSFHATKFIHSFEGGAIVTNRDDIAEKSSLMRNFGFAGFDRVVHVGTNGKMTEVCAAMGLSSLEDMFSIIAVNRENLETYSRELSGLPGIECVTHDRREKANYQYVVLEVDAERSPLSRDELIAVLHSENVIARRYFFPGCHRMEPYLSTDPDAGLRLPVTERLAGRVLVLPTGLSMDQQAIKTVCSIIRTAVTNAGEVREGLKAWSRKTSNGNQST